MECAANSIGPLTSRAFQMIRRKLHLTPVGENTDRDTQTTVFHQSTAVIITTRDETHFLRINPVTELMAVHKTLSGWVLTKVALHMEPPSKLAISTEDLLGVAFLLCEKTSTVR